MTLRRIVYAAALLGAVVFYWAYREWLSWLVLMLLVFLPWFSLLLSLPAMLCCRAEISCPQAVEKDARVSLLWQGRSPFPLPRLTGRLLVKNHLCGTKMRLRSGDELPTDHCGLLGITLRRPRCHDYLGLFSLPIRRQSQCTVLVRPTPVAPAQVPDLSRFQVNMWRPKPGGGFSENHELRLYRPGDNLKQVHWKLSAKTGKLISREPMEPIRNQMLLTTTLRGTPDELDTKLGRLLWMSRHLLSLELPHSIQCFTGAGLMDLDITCPEDLTRAMDALLRAPTAPEAQATFSTAHWRHHIGGAGDE